MIDKKTESDIRAAKSFLEFWAKFHSVYAGIISNQRITEEDEARFLDTKNMISGKYEELKNTLDLKYMPHGRLTDPVSDILALTGVRFVSEEKVRKFDDDWKDSYVFLNGILERLKNNKRRFEQFNSIGVFLKRALEKKQS